MIGFRQHVPAFVDGVEPVTGNVAALDDLLALPFARSWSDGPKFTRWSYSSHGVGDYLLMAEEKDGKFWVVAYLDTEPDLPKWKRPDVADRS